MASYVIGDVHGCYDELCELLDKINYQPAKDRLFFTGDLVGRGAQPLAVLRKIKELPNSQLVLGNHDLHLIALYSGAPQATAHPDASLTEVLNALDGLELIDWLRHQPLAFYDNKHDFILVHAGIAPQWTRQDALIYAAELETALQGPRDQLKSLMNHLYGDEPTRWQDSISGMKRLRLIANYFTRMRLCSSEGELSFVTKATKATKKEPNKKYKPWFSHHRPDPSKIIFGHWAALSGKTNNPKIIGLDYGCVWGYSLAALRLKDAKLFLVAAKNKISKKAHS